MGLELTRGVESGFAETIYRWCNGVTLEDVIEDLDGAPGDFIRSSKQTLDLLKQVADSFDHENPILATLEAAVEGIDRGVVSYTGMI